MRRIGVDLGADPVHRLVEDDRLKREPCGFEIRHALPVEGRNKQRAAARIDQRAFGYQPSYRLANRRHGGSKLFGKRAQRQHVSRREFASREGLVQGAVRALAQIGLVNGEDFGPGHLSVLPFPSAKSRRKQTRLTSFE